MTNLIGIYDHSTGKQTTREMTSAEIATYEADNAKRAADKVAHAAKKQEAKEALLSSLGISEEHAIILGLIEAPLVAREISAE